MKKTISLPTPAKKSSAEHIQILPVQVNEVLGAKSEETLVGAIDTRLNKTDLNASDIYILWNGTDKSLAKVEKEGPFWYLYGTFSYPRPGVYPVTFDIKGIPAEGQSVIAVGNTEERWLTDILIALFGEDYEDNDFQYYDQLLKKGLSHVQLLQDILDSNSWLEKQVETSYRSILARKPTSEEVHEGLKTVRENGGTTDLRAKLYNLPEFCTGTPQEFIELLTTNAVMDSVLRIQTARILKESLTDGTAREQLAAIALASSPVQLSLIEAYRTQLSPTVRLSDVKVSALLANWRGKAGEQKVVLTLLSLPIRFLPIIQMAPDIIMQFDFLSADLEQTLLTQINNLVGDLQVQVNQDFPQANIIPDPAADLIFWNTQYNGGVWFDAPIPFIQEIVLQGVNLATRIGELYAFQFTASALQTAVSKFWAVSAKTRDTNGNPDPNGDVVLTGYSFDMANDTITLKIHAVQHTELHIDVYVTVTYTDVLSLDSNGHIQVQSSSKLDIDDTALKVAEAFFFLVIPAIVDSLVLELIDSMRQTQEAAASAPVFPSLGALLQQNFTIYILEVGTTRKIDFQYDYLTVDDVDGFVVGSFIDPEMPRQPSAAIRGTAEIFAEDPLVTWVSTNKPGMVGAKLVYGIGTTDMRAPIIVQWHYNGINYPGNTADFNSITLVLQFTTGEKQTREISATATDADGQVVNAFFSTTYLGTQQRPSPPNNTTHPRPLLTTENPL